MKERLETLKTLIENEMGAPLEAPKRRRELNYARAVFCKIARDMASPYTMPYADIGKYINRNHATVMHSCKSVFDEAMTEPKFKTMYEVLSLTFDDLKNHEADMDSVQNIAEKYSKLREENDLLKHKYAALEKENKRFADMVDGLSEEELDEVYDKMYIFTKAIKNRVYTYVRKSKEESV